MIVLIGKVSDFFVHKSNHNTFSQLKDEYFFSNASLPPMIELPECKKV